MSKKVRASARVQVTLEIEGAGGAWGGDCSLEQLHKQGKEGALQLLVKNLPGGWRLVGDPKVTAILIEEDH